MKIITKNSDYAIRAIVYLGKNKGRFVPSREIAKKEKIPLIFLRRILQELIKKHLVASKEGVTGGVKLIKNSKQISIAKVINIIQGDIELIECMFRKQLCQNRSKCVFRKKVMEIEKKVIREFEKLTIEDLIVETKR